MRLAIGFLGCLILSGCAEHQVAREGDAIPYKAIVVFRWNEPPPAPRVGDGGGPDDQPAPASGQAAGAAGPLDPTDSPARAAARQEVEDAILDGLEEFQVFSDFKATEAAWASEVAASEKADLIIQVRLGDLAQWDENASQIVPGPAILDTLLWLMTGIGSWWIGDQEYPTQSGVQVGWRRAEGPPAKVAPPTAEEEFRTKERISGGQYRLSFWERSKPWRAPLPYLLSIICPPPFVPLKDAKEVDHSLQASALKDLKRELARKLKGGSIGAGGAPFLFRLQRPLNGAMIEGRRVQLAYRYRVESGFDEHLATRLGSLTIHVKRGDSDRYELLRTYSGDQIRSINEKIPGDQEIVEEIDGLSPGLNLIRFTAIADFDKQPITNTVAILCR